MRRRIATVAWLTVVWIALWGDASLGNLITGIVIGVALVVILPAPRRPPNPERVHPWKALRFAGYYVVELARTNALVIYEVFTPQRKLVEGIVAVPCPNVSDGLTTLLTNTITLTPGTLVLEIRNEKIYVHVLNLKGIESAREGLRAHIRRAIDAFGPPEALEAFESMCREESR